ncbi:hypothetical protein Q8W71_30770 [Methylobacterium sp. NEAU 140]|uniref:hypothetical protein n=1 Tax=Methylobacterium sp. NEAU 140 TaxID=3064945 RepID=UPI002734545F|nr:hypothetical protein [Methylobacterium sp. NEAU 140]MDP4026976.1 hypothetical protein [Methylobacterium sp. NEAU 140]
MKTRLTMRAALAAGLPALARDIARGRRLRRGCLGQGTREAGRGNLITAAGLLLLYLVAL